MESIIPEKMLTFKELEEKIFKMACGWASEAMKSVLENYDAELMRSRDTSAYRHKGRKSTTVKTVFGEVGFSRAVYQTENEDGTHLFVFLLDEAVGLNTIGLFSELYVEKLMAGITTKSYRSCAEEVSGTTGQSISAMGCGTLSRSSGRSWSRRRRTLWSSMRRKACPGGPRLP